MDNPASPPLIRATGPNHPGVRRIAALGTSLPHRNNTPVHITAWDFRSVKKRRTRFLYRRFTAVFFGLSASTKETRKPIFLYVRKPTNRDEQNELDMTRVNGQICRHPPNANRSVSNLSAEDPVAQSMPNASRPNGTLHTT
jgi:hypothetical protein